MRSFSLQKTTENVIIFAKKLTGEKTIKDVTINVVTC